MTRDCPTFNDEGTLGTSTGPKPIFLRNPRNSPGIPQETLHAPVFWGIQEGVTLDPLIL